MATKTFLQKPLWQKGFFAQTFTMSVAKMPVCSKQKTVEGFTSLQKAMHIVAKRSGDMVKYTGKEKIP